MIYKMIYQAVGFQADLQSGLQSGLQGEAEMISLKVTLELLEGELFSSLETVSWKDTLFCLVAYFYALCFITFTLFLPLVLFFVIFISR